MTVPTSAPAIPSFSSRTRNFRRSSLILGTSIASLLGLTLLPAQTQAQSTGVFSTSGTLGLGDSDDLVGLDPSKNYIDAVDLGSTTPLTISGVNFEAVADVNPTGDGWSISGLTNPFPTGGTNPQGQLGALTNNFVYGGNPAVFTLNGLTVGETYILSFYNRSFDAASLGRVQEFVASDASTASAVLDQDVGAAGQGELNVIRYTFLASSDTQTLSIRPLNPGNTMHFYGFTTEQTFNNTWTSGANWSTANWSVGQPNAAGTNASFGTQASPQTVTLDQDRTVGHLEFEGVQAWTLAGTRTLTLQADVGGISTLSTPTGSHTVAARLELVSPTAKFGTGTLILNGVVGGAEGLSVDGGTLVLGAANQYLGGTTVNTGTLRLNGPGTLGGVGTQLTVNTGGLLDVNGAAPIVGNLRGSGGTILNNATGTNAVFTIGAGNAGGGNFAGVIADNSTGTGTLALTKTGAGTITLSGANTYTGATVINDGRLQLAGQAAGALTTSGIQVSGTGVLGFTAGTASTLALKPGATLTLAGGTIALDLGSVNGSDKITAGTLALTANSRFAFNPITPLSLGTPYTLASYSTLSNPGGFTVAGLSAGRLSITPTVGATAITATAVLDSGTWNNSGGGDWSTGPWTNYTPNAIGDSAVFGPALLGNGVVTIAAPQTIGYLTFNNAVASYELGTQGSSNLTIQNGAFPAVVSVAAGTHGISENVTFATNVVLTTATNTTLTANGVISGPGSLTKFGAGTLITTNANTYTGGTVITEGTLQLGNGVKNGSIVGNIVNNGSLAVNNALDQEIAGVITGTGNVIKSAAGKLTLKGANTFTGGLTISAGTVDVGGGTATGSVVGNITNNGVLRISRTGVTTIDAVVNGTGSTIITGGISQTLSPTAAINTPTLTVGDALQGYVYFGAPNQMNGTTGVLLQISPHAANSRINLNGFDQTIAGLTGTGIVQNHETATGTPAATLTINVPASNSYSWNGLIRNQNGGAVGLTKKGAGEQTMLFSIAQPTYSGVTQVEAGRLVFGSTFLTPTWNTPEIVVSAGAEVGLTGAGVGVLGWNMNRPISGDGSLRRVGNDTNIVTINNATNSFTGATILSGTGSLSVATLANIGTNSTIGAGDATSNATNAASLVFDGGTLRYTGGTLNINRLFTITEKGGALNSAGTGSLNFTNPGTLGTSGSGARTLVLTGTNAGTIGGILADGTGGATALTKNLSGTWVLSGANTYTGATTVNGGRLQLEGAATTTATSNVVLNNGGTLGFSSGVGSTLTLGGTLTLSGGSTAFDLGLAAASDKIVANTLALTANSSFAFNTIGKYEYGSTYTLATYGTLSNPGGFTISGVTAGRLALQPVVGASAITMVPTLDSAIWDSTGGGTWATGPWTGYTPNAIGDAALFGTKLAASGTVAIGAPVKAGYLTFDNAAASYTIGAAGSANLTLVTTGTSTAQVVVESGSHTIAEDVTLGSDLSVRTSASTNLAINGALKGTGRTVTKTGAGTLTLAGASDFGTTGAAVLNVNEGTVVAGSATALPAGLGLRMNGGTLDLNGNDATLASLAGLTGAITDRSATAGVTKVNLNQTTSTLFGGILADGTTRLVGVQKGGAGTLTLTGANTFTGGLTVTQGAVVAANSSGVSLPGDVTLGNGTSNLFLIMGAPNQFGADSVITFANGATDNKLELRGYNQTVAGIDSTASDTLSIIQNQEAVDSVGSATLTINATENHDFFGLIRPLGSTPGNSLNLVKDGPGTQIIRNTYAAQTNFGVATINQGKLEFDFDTRANGGAGHNSLGGESSFVVQQGGTLGLAGNWDMSRPVSGAGNVLKEGLGTVTVSGALTHTGLTTVAEGMLVVTGSITGSSQIDVKADATLDVFSAQGGFEVGQTQTLTGVGTVTGPVAIAGTVAPGPGIGTLTMDSLTFNGGGRLALEIDTSTRVSDLITASGDLDLDLAVAPKLMLTDLGANVALALGTRFTLLTYAGDWNGGLFSVGDTVVPDGGVFTLGANQFQLDYNAGNNSLALVAVPEPGAATLLFAGLAGLVGFRRRRE